jgi:hypothetical protein
MKDLLPIVFSSLMVTVVAYMASSIVSHTILKLICGVIGGIIFYVSVHGITKSKELRLLFDLIITKIYVKQNRG